MKGEIFSSDLVISIVVFITTLLILGIYLTNTEYSISESYEIKNIEETSYEIANQLATNPGYPSSWTPNNFEIIGLYDEPYINFTKFLYMKQIGYDDVKKSLGLKEHELFIELWNKNGKIDIFGKEPNGSLVISTERFGISLINNTVQKIKLKVILWK